MPSRQRRVFALGLGLALILTVWLWPRGFEHDPPRQLPWAIPDVREGRVAWEVLPDGRLRLSIEHAPLPGVSAPMLAWWYQILPLGRVRLGQQAYPLYHLFHPSEHGRVWVVEPGRDGCAGMCPGALVARQEWFGPWDSEGSGRILALSAEGMIVRPEVMGLGIGLVQHQFADSPLGARYRVETVIGVDWPMVGPLVNAWLRARRFPPPMLAEWGRHQLEEVAMLRHFLPALYAQRDRAPNFAIHP